MGAEIADCCCGGRLCGAQIFTDIMMPHIPLPISFPGFVPR